jgi:hypothetical protein
MAGVWTEIELSHSELLNHVSSNPCPSCDCRAEWATLMRQTDRQEMPNHICEIK